LNENRGHDSAAAFQNHRFKPLTRHEDEEVCDITNNHTIADLFPNCTILLGVIAGFTALTLIYDDIVANTHGWKKDRIHHSYIGK
jgi:hypothetical protein